MTIPRNLSFLAQGASATGVLSVPYGGTGLTTLTVGYIPYGNGTGALASSSNLYFDGNNLGLGTTPSAWNSGAKALQIKNYTTLYEDSGGGSNLSFNAYQSSTGSKYIQTEAASVYYQVSGNHRWYTAPSSTAGSAITWTQAMTLFNSGGLSLGNTTDPGATNLSVTGTVISSTVGAASGNALSLQSNGTTNATLDTSGTLSVGTTDNGGANTGGFELYNGAGASRLYIGHVTGTANGTQYIVFNYNGTSQIGSVSQSGTTAVLYNTTSDYRLKNDITPITNALSIIEALNPVHFTWVDGRPDDGFLAHELQAVIPNCVTGEKDAVNENGTPKYQQMDSSGVIPFLVKAIQELKTEINQLKGKL